MRLCFFVLRDDLCERRLELLLLEPESELEELELEESDGSGSVGMPEAGGSKAADETLDSSEIIGMKETGAGPGDGVMKGGASGGAAGAGTGAGIGIGEGAMGAGTGTGAGGAGVGVEVCTDVNGVAKVSLAFGWTRKQEKIRVERIIIFRLW